MTEVVGAAFCVYDTEENKYWKKGNKIYWTSQAAAKNAWNSVNGQTSNSRYWSKVKLKNFNEQERYVVHRCKVMLERAG